MVAHASSVARPATVEQATPGKKHEGRTMSDFMDHPKDVAWLSRELQLTPGRPACFFGPFGSCKTAVAQCLAVAFCWGQPLWGVDIAKPMRVGHYDFDFGQDHLENRYRAIAKDCGIPRDRWGDLFVDGSRDDLVFHPPGRDSGTYEDLMVGRWSTATAQHDIVIVDCLEKVFPGQEETSNLYHLPLRVWQRISKQTGRMFLFLHHSGKNAKAGMKGNTSVPNGVSSAWQFASEANDTLVRLSHFKHSYGARSPDFVLRKVPICPDDSLSPLRFDLVAREERRATAARSKQQPSAPVNLEGRVIDAIRKANESGLYPARSGISHMLGLRKADGLAAADRLVASGQIVDLGTATRSRLALPGTVLAVPAGSRNRTEPSAVS